MRDTGVSQAKRPVPGSCTTWTCSPMSAPICRSSALSRSRRLESTGTPTTLTTRNSDTNSATDARTPGTEMRTAATITAAAATSARRGQSRRVSATGSCARSCARSRSRNCALNRGEESLRNASSQASWLILSVLMFPLVMFLLLTSAPAAFRPRGAEWFRRCSR